jgi:hypothetical protein
VGSNPIPGTTVGAHDDHDHVPHIRPIETVESALRASDAGMRDSDNAHLHGVAIKTIRRWRRLYQRRGLPRGQAHTNTPCPRCDGAELESDAYAELLGWYLGDGHISRGRRGVYNLHVVDDARYVDDIARIAVLMSTVKRGGKPHTRRSPGCVIVTVSWKHWPCLIPQLGPGRKHERPIILEDWQRAIVESHPASFLRGLFHSDGCRANNWTRKIVAGEWKRYDYPRWQFTNHSADIRELCCWALDLVGVPWRQSNRYVISVSTRAGVARLDELIGLKS